jgi:D-amino-acid dehydrogenase
MRVTSVAVVGAGVAGLSTAWFLQDHDVEVTVLERAHVAAGASWGNAGWLMAGDVTPLPSPATLRMGLRGLASSTSSALSVPLRADPGLYRFLLRFARHCTAAHWSRSMQALIPLGNAALEAYDALSDGGVAAAPTPSRYHLACFTDLASRDAFTRHLEDLRGQGVRVEFETMDGAAARASSPVASESVTGAVGLRGQRFLDPTLFVPALAASVVERGGTIETSAAVRSLRDVGRGAEVLVMRDDRPSVRRFDAVVVCTGAWLSDLVHRFGVRVPVRAGRGYSFNARLVETVGDPVYLPDQHLACTPMRGRLRIAGAMEFRRPGEPLDPRRIAAMVEAARPMLRNVDLDDRTDEWVGPRPVSVDGLPLAGPTRSPRVWCVGGHAMEGMVLGPVTARLTAESLARGSIPRELLPLDPLR